jgi:hypothetical protein
VKRLPAHEGDEAYDKEVARNSIFQDELSDDEWQILSQYVLLLEPLNDATDDLQGRPGVKNNLGLIHVQQDIECIVEDFTQALKDYGTAPNTTLESEWHFSKQIQIALDKAQDYYARLDDSSAYLAAVVLHPKYKWEYLEAQWATKKSWLADGRAAVTKLWLTYAQQPISEAISSPNKLNKSGRELNKMQAYRAKSFEKAKSRPPTRAVRDEYSLYCHQMPDITCEHPLQWWSTTGFKTYPHLARMAIDILSIPAMSDEPERVFSRLGLMVTKRRNHLHQNTIQASQCLYSWDSAGIINLRDPPPTVE